MRNAKPSRVEFLKLKQVGPDRWFIDGSFRLPVHLLPELVGLLSSQGTLRAVRDSRIAKTPEKRKPR